MENHSPEGVEEQRAVMSAADQNDLPDSAFAYIEPGGKKDAEGKTTPRKLRHYPVHDKAHADNAAARAATAIEEGGDAAAIAKKALPKIKEAQAKFDKAEEKAAADWNAHHRDGPSYGDLQDMLSSAAAEKFKDNDGDDDWIYVFDFGDDWLVFSKSGEKFRAPYSVNGNDVTLGDSEPVRVQTTYTPMETKSAALESGKNWATAKRAFSSLMEQPPAHTGEIQVRLDGGEDSPVAHFVGYASTTGVPYSVRDWLGEYTETILPGAFAKTLREQGNVPLLFNHDGIPLASTGSGTSRLSEDAKGLRNEADLDRRDALTNSICVQLQRGVLDKMSFSFRATKDTWNDAYDDRGVNEAALYDSSVVTYPANPATSAELVDSMRSALGREGRSLWLADSELSVRSLLPVVVENRSGMPEEGDDLLEKAFRALVRADEVLCRSHGPHGRSRTFRVAEALMELRAGKALSSKNQTLLQQAADALASADKNHQKLADAHASAAGKIQSVLDAASNDAASQDGKSNGTPPGNGNPIMPQDGAGPRSARALQLKRQREAELRALRGE